MQESLHYFWDSIIEPLLTAADARAIVEIGTEHGTLTDDLAAYCVAHGGILHTIDPVCQIDREYFQKTYGGAFIFHQERSLSALPKIEKIDAVIIDGDHNWYTVYHELLLIENYSKKTSSPFLFPLVILHDIGWPYGRRDTYANPDAVPPHFRHPYEKKGMIPGQGLLTENGFNADALNAIDEHMIRNGVLTAVEDFLKETKLPIRFVGIPGLHGLGILVSTPRITSSRELAHALDDLLSGKTIESHIREMERMRIEREMEITRMRSDVQNEQGRRRCLHKELLEERQKRFSAEKQWAEEADNRLSVQIELSKKESQRQCAEERCGNIQKELEEIRLGREERERELEELQREKRDCEQELEKIRLGREERERELEELQREKRDCEQELEKLRQEKVVAHQTIRHICNTRSWRWTFLLRECERSCRRFISHVFSALKDIWLDFGEPFPRTIRFIRHNVLGHVFPAKEDRLSVLSHVIAPQNPEINQARPMQNIAVIIVCHNSGPELAATINSVLSQTHKPMEIVVVDDDSEKEDVRAVALRYADKGVEYLRGSWKNRSAARNAGLRCTESSILTFLIPGIVLNADYFESCANLFAQNSQAAIAYTDESLHPFERERFYRENTIPDYAVVRRDALQKVGGWPQGLWRDAEWITWRRILSDGWEVAKIPSTTPSPSPSPSSFAKATADRQSLPAGQAGSPLGRGSSVSINAALCLSLSGRQWMWPLTRAFLERQEYPHEDIHLVIIDTSQERECEEMVRDWIENSDYGEKTYLPLSTGIKGLADLPRRTVKREVAAACALIYNSFIPHCAAPWVFFLEDDVIPPIDAYPRLLKHFDNDKIASVTACCMQRSSPYPIAWQWDSDGLPAKIVRQERGTTSIGGNGLFCTVVRGERVRETIFHTGPSDLCHDHNFYRLLTREAGFAALIDWSCVCRHYISPHEWV